MTQLKTVPGEKALGVRQEPSISGIPEFSGIGTVERACLADIHGLFIPSLATTLSVYLRTLLSGTPIEIEEVPWSEITAEIAPECSVWLRSDRLPSGLIARFSGGIVGSILELLMGGTGKFKAELDRPLTQMEQALFEPLFGLIAGELRRTWNTEGLMPSEDDPDMALQPPEGNGLQETLVQLRAELTAGEVSGRFDLFLPGPTVHSLCHGNRTDRNYRDGEDVAGRLQRMVYETLEVQLDCELRGADVSIRELMDLRAGKILDLGVPFDASLTVALNSVPAFRGSVFQEGSLMTFTVESWIPPSPCEGGWPVSIGSLGTASA